MNILKARDSILTKFDEGLWNAVIEKLVGRSAKEVTIVNRDGSKVQWKMV